MTSDLWAYAIVGAVGGFAGALLVVWAANWLLGEARACLGPFTIFRSRPGDIGPGRSWICWHSVEAEGLWMYNAETLPGLVRDTWRNWKNDNSLVG